MNIHKLIIVSKYSLGCSSRNDDGDDGELICKMAINLPNGLWILQRMIQFIQPFVLFG